MALLQIIYAPNAIFKKKAKSIELINEEIQQIAKDMLETMYAESAVGLGANMVGIDKRIIVLDLRESGVDNPYVMINPEIEEFSEDQNEYEEASLSFPGVSAKLKRSTKVTVKYLDLDSKEQILVADNFLARVIQHELDYLDGVVFLDKLSKLKRDMLTKKMLKYIKNHPPHVHGEHCHH